MTDEFDSERTEAASPRRLEKAREEGQVARSQELTTFIMLFTGGVALWLTGAELFGKLNALLSDALRFDVSMLASPATMMIRFEQAAGVMLTAFIPLMVILVLAALAAPQLLGGWLFSTQALRFDLHRINPLSGFARLASWHGVAELAKALVKAGLVTAVAVAVMWHNKDALLQLGRMPLSTGIAQTGQLIGSSFLLIVGALALVAAADVPFQLWRHANGLKMSREDLRQEMREMEGDPQVKSAIRNQQRQIARRRMMSEVPKADVIVTNPTHYAVALRYEDKSMRAPRVVAKGAGELAAKIRAVGAENRVPLLEAPALARALYQHAEIGDEIPERLYNAVAEVLAYVFQLRRHQEQGGAVPQPLTVVEVPADLDPQGGLQ